MKVYAFLLCLAFAEPMSYRKIGGLKMGEFAYLERLIWFESTNDPRAKSPKGAIGLMQITQDVLDDYYTFCGIRYTLKEMYEPSKNIEVGVWQLRRLKKYYGCEIKTVSAFNMGIGNTDNMGEDALYPGYIVINFKYVFDILGTNKVMRWLDGRKVTPWRGTSTVYYVEEK